MSENVGGTVEYLTTKAFAERVGLRPGWVRQLRMAGMLPEPDAMTGDQPGWKPETVDRWKAERG